MSNDTKANSDPSINEQNEIFKSLSHEIRRKIIIILGEQKAMSFTDLKNGLGLNIDSPTLAYHLKSLKMLVDQKENNYFLTDIGEAALILINKIDQSERFNKGKKKIMYANIVTTICWVFTQVSVSNIISPYVEMSVLIPVILILNIVPQINYLVIWNLWGRTYFKKKNKKEKKI